MWGPLSPRTPAGAGKPRGTLVRGNAYRFADRYGALNDSPFACGTFGRVHRCEDALARIPRAVKRIPVPEEEDLSNSLAVEVDTLVTLEHPHIVRLIEYFVEDGEVLLVMELLSGPNLGDQVRKMGHFGEELSARCLRHMLKALLCCHCQGIAHNDVNSWNFRFVSPAQGASLKMVDFGLSERMAQGLPPGSKEGKRNRFVQKRDVWSAGAILFEMLSGRVLLSGSGSGSVDAARQLEIETDPSFVPRQLQSLQQASHEARELLGLMLEPSPEKRLGASEALKHCFITRFYPAKTVDPGKHPLRFSLEECLEGFEAFHQAVHLKRLALLVVAHLVDESSDLVAAVEWQFRCLVRDGWTLEESRLREVLEEESLQVPADFGEQFRSADVFALGALDHVGFLAVALSTACEIYCQPEMLKAVFGFLDASDTGFIDSGSLSLVLRPMRTGSEEDASSWLAEASAMKQQMRFADFRAMMVPLGWEHSPGSGAPAAWADNPDRTDSNPEFDASVLTGASCGAATSCGSPSQAGSTSPMVPSGPSEAGSGSGGDVAKTITEGRTRSKSVLAVPQATPNKIQISPVQSAPSELFSVRQMPGFHTRAMRPYYAALPISNVVTGIIRGTSGYARQSVALRLAEVKEVFGQNGESAGSFFIMPNPKYHWSPEDCLSTGKLRFVVWWIPPMHAAAVERWVSQVPIQDGGAGPPPPAGPEAPQAPSLRRARSRTLSVSLLDELEKQESVSSGIGAPGDFGFSEVAKPPDYLHTCRDLRGEHLTMLEQLVSNVRSYLGRVLGDNLETARISAGFHYPVRPQYSTLHLQLRVNSGDVCGGKESRGVDLFQLLPLLKEDPGLLSRDDVTLHYRANANLHQAVLEAAAAAGLRAMEVGCQSLILGG